MCSLYISYNRKNGVWEALTLLLFLQQQSWSSTKIPLFTHHDIVKQYRKGLTAVVDRCVVYTYSSIGTTVCSETFCSLLLFCSRLVHADLAMHATLAALGTLPRYMSLWAPGPGWRHASRVLWWSFQTVQSTTPGLQLVTSIYRRATTLWAHG